MDAVRVQEIVDAIEHLIDTKILASKNSEYYLDVLRAKESLETLLRRTE